MHNIIRSAVEKLAKAGVDNPEIEARIIISRALNYDRAQLIIQEGRALTPPETEIIRSFIDRRAKREPVGRILGEREFWSLPFGLNEATLEPRPDSETVVEAALKIWTAQSPPPLGGSNPKGFDARRDWLGGGSRPDFAPACRILDLGTGTGCLLLALLHELPQATALGVDKAPRAIEQARLNAERLGLQNRAEFRTGDWLEGLSEKFDLIVCNPPYIAAADIPSLSPEVRDYDPVAALDGGADGLDAYRRLIPQLPRFLNPRGAAVFECGQGQADAVRELFRNSGFTGIAVFKDLGGIDRCVAARTD